MITTHQYLDMYPIRSNSEKLILGTIHPHDHNNFVIPFFYGNVMSIWKILNQAFPEELPLPLRLKEILQFLERRKISVSDTIKQCERIRPTALDKDLIPLKLNTGIIDDIRKSNIKEIFFTSGFQKNNAFRLFYIDILGRKITDEIRKKRQVVLDKEIFGRSIVMTILYSPSGSSNIGLSKSKLYLQNREKYINSAKPISDFKVDYYYEKFR